MKLFSLFALTLFAAHSFAQAAPVTCSVGELGEDSRFELSISKDRKNAVVFNFHETTYVLSRSQIVKNGNSIAVVGQKVKGTSEGTEFTEQVDALMVYNPANRTINLTLITGGFVHFAAAELQCK